MGKRDLPGVGVYGGAAGGWGALQAVAGAVRAQMALSRETNALRRTNQPEGFDCPGCAWPDPRHASSFEFCENGAKAVAWEATRKLADPAFFEAHTVSKLWNWSDHALEDVGRLAHPMRYDAESDRYLSVSWDEAFGEIGDGLRALPDPDMAEFYTSGRASNEAAFLFQLFVRQYGTNNFPDCSNMCHEATSVGLPESIGVGKGTVTLEDFDHADAVFCFGHNPGTNHPRMLATLRDVSKRGGKIVVFNPLRERGLERFTSPQNLLEMVTLRSTPIATSYHQVKVGGDAALLKGMMKALFALEAGGRADAIDRAFIAEHTHDIDNLAADIATIEWPEIERLSGLSRGEIEGATEVYASCERVIFCYGMGLTQHRDGTSIVQQLANLLLMRGNIGKPGAGVCPLRGHSNVQGDRTVGITEIPTEAFLDRLEATFGFSPPRGKGHGAVEAIQAMLSGEAKALVALGGNLAVAMPDPEATFAAMRRLDLSVHIATKLNRSHLLLGKRSYILPCLGRTELDRQTEGPQAITVEDSMSMVHASMGKLKPASEHLMSEPAIVARIARAVLPKSTVEWDWMVGDYGRVRDAIERVFPDFRDFNARIREPLGFRLPVAASERVWKTATGRANFIVTQGLSGDPRDSEPGMLKLATIRSHDQYNTTIYGFNDRYRGIKGRRDIVFLNEQDLEERGLEHGDLIDVEAIPLPGDPESARIFRGLTAVGFAIARGSAAAYYPEANPLVALGHHDIRSGTPAYKSIPVRIRRSEATERDTRRADLTSGGPKGRPYLTGDVGPSSTDS